MFFGITCVERANIGSCPDAPPQAIAVLKRWFLTRRPWITLKVKGDLLCGLTVLTVENGEELW